MLHISAHGVFDLRHVDGRRRSGVVLSDGLLITAAEIEAMEIVPELVFLNCCHLGKIDIGARRQQAGRQRRARADRDRRALRGGGRLGGQRQHRAPVRRDLLRGLLLDQQPFGDAVFEARKAAWDGRPGQDITWGAFQAYGDPGWLAEPRAARSERGGALRPTCRSTSCATSCRGAAPTCCAVASTST